MPGQLKLETVLRPGQVVGTQYRVDALIAKGGMAAVWSGVNEHTGKRVALKVILRSFASNGDATELFRREALAASKVNHPNVVNIFDVIDHEGMTCIVMELLEGVTLGEYLKKNGPLSLEATAALLLPAMRGVAAANAKGVVHRDLKPGNIFLCIDPDGHMLTTKVLDFGISLMKGLGGEPSSATGTLAMFGTPAYMAPEAIALSPGIDGRADVYGFGVLFFEALTGKLPFIGPPGLELLKRVLTEPPPRVTAYRSDLSPEIDNLIDRALSKSADDRFGDMEHLIRATEDCLQALQPTPGGVTPMAGPSLSPPVESNCGTAIPVVQAPYEQELSKVANRNVTRALYSLASEAPRATDRAGIGESRKPASVDARSRARRQHVGRANSWNPPKRRAAMGVAMVVFLIVTAWVSVPASSSDSGGSRWQSATSSEIAARARRPVVSPLPETRITAVAAAATLDNPSGSVAGGESVRANGQRAPIAIPIRAAVSHPSKIVARGKSTSQWPPTADPTNQPLPPRAGRLSPSDF